MINFTPVKNNTLEILGKGKLSYTEMRIAVYVLRNSRGYSFNGVRQKWTKEMSVPDIAEANEMDRAVCSRAINKMIRERKLLKRGDKFQFNEHFKSWVVQKNTAVAKSHTVANYHKAVASCNNQSQTNTDENKVDPNPKETLKETLKEKNINILSDDRKEIQNKTINNGIIKTNSSSVKGKMTKEEVEQCIDLVLWFAKEILHTEVPDKIWISREMRNARRLLFEMKLPMEFIKKICTWRIKDSFWRLKFHSLGSIISHLTDWTGEAKMTPLTFTAWLDDHLADDYRKEENRYVKANRYLIAFKKAAGGGVVFTSEEIRKKTVAIRIMKEETKHYTGG
ncbi:MAG: hypothetical protein U9Q18_02995 [Caldisericota bacterium]|nr:hypothetical protein [Caldisericota bacterium]